MDPIAQQPDQPAPPWDALPPSGATSRLGWRARLVVIAVFAGATLAACVIVLATLHSSTGNVYFSKTAYDTSSGTCQFNSPVNTVSSSDPVYLVAVFNDTIQAQDNYTLEVARNGVSLGTSNVTADAKFSCYIEQTSVGPLSPGVYVFTFRHNDTIEAEGTLNVK